MFLEVFLGVAGEFLLSCDFACAWEGHAKFLPSSCFVFIHLLVLRKILQTKLLAYYSGRLSVGLFNISPCTCLRFDQVIAIGRSEVISRIDQEILSINQPS